MSNNKFRNKRDSEDSYAFHQDSYNFDSNQFQKVSAYTALCFLWKQWDFFVTI